MLLRMVAIAATLALAMPTLAVAQGNNQHHPGGGKPPAGKPPGAGGAKPAFRLHRSCPMVHTACFMPNVLYPMVHARSFVPHRPGPVGYAGVAPVVALQ